MIKAYIYGTPKGFDAYGSDKSFEGYLKGFYITSRRGKRLMVNRRANGETIYSYLHYGLMEYSDIGKDKAGRTSSFFGMSLHISNGIYTPDLKRVFDWFDYWFNKILEDGTILKEVSSGYIQYQVSKFANVNNIEHLHSNLPNIFSEKSGTIMLDYDDSFVEGKSGQIAQLNNDEDNNVILSTFKHYQWIALSPIFKKIEKSADICIELDFNDLNDRLAEYNKMLLPIAINRNASSVDELRKINDAVQDNYSSITSYLKVLSNGNDNAEEYNKFSTLASDYVAVCENIAALKLKLASTDDSGEAVTINKPKTKFCYHCQEHKDISEFRTTDSTKCIACEEKIAHSQKKQCGKCGQTKTYAEFERGSKICKKCESKKVSIGLTIPSWVKIAVPSTIVLVIAITCVLKFFNNPTITDPVDPVEPTYEQTQSLQKVDDDTFEEFVNQYQYKDAYDYLAGKSNKKDYLPFDKKIVDQLWSIINNSIDDSDYGINSLNEMIMDQIVCIDSYALTPECRELIISAVNYHAKLVELLKLNDNKFGPDSYNKASGIIARYENYDNNWSDVIESKYEKYKVANAADKTSVTTSISDGYGSIYLVHLDINYDPIRDEQGNVEVENIAIKPGGEILVGTYKKLTFIDICYDKNKIRIKTKKYLDCDNNPSYQPQASKYGMNATYRVKFDKAGTDVIYIENLEGEVLMEKTIMTAL